MFIAVTMETSQATRGIIAAVHVEGYSAIDIGSQLRIHGNTTALIVRRHADTGATDDMPRVGRPHSINADEDLISCVLGDNTACNIILIDVDNNMWTITGYGICFFFLCLISRGIGQGQQTGSK